MFEKEQIRALVEKINKPLPDQFVCPETKEYTSLDSCDSTNFDKGCSFKNKCKAYQEWKNKTIQE